MGQVGYPEPVRELIEGLKTLPGIGARSAERIAIWLLQHKKGDPAGLAERLVEAAGKVKNCQVCGFFATETGCPACDQKNREAGLICVVEQPADVLPIERSGIFSGYYHCLGGRLSPLDDVGPEDLRIGSLVRRVREEPGTEVILANGSDVEGEATANYLSEILKELDCSVSRLAQGLPAGGGLEFADDLTLTRAFEGRKRVGKVPGEK